MNINHIKRLVFQSLCYVLFLTTVILTGLANSNGVIAETQSNIPSEVQNFFRTSRWSDWKVTSWVNPDGQKNETACAFATIKKGSSNTLLAFRWKDGQWKYYWNNPSALPQVAESIILGETTSSHRNFTSFYVYNNEIQEMFCVWEQQKSGEWELQELQHFGYFSPNKGLMFFDTSKSGVIKLTNAGWVEGKETNTKVYGEYQRNPRYFNLSAFPMTLKEAQIILSNPPQIPYGDFQVQSIKFSSRKKYPVYTGPGKEYLRSSNGKASVSTNDWIQVFGKENG